MGHGVLQVSFKSLTSLLQVSYKSLTSLLQISHKSLITLIHTRDIAHRSWGRGHGVQAMGPGSFVGSGKLR